MGERVNKHGQGAKGSVSESILEGVEEDTSTLEGTLDDAEGPPSVAAWKSAPMNDVDDSGEEMMTTMRFRFSIPRAATDTVLGEGGGTLALLKGRTGYTTLVICGEPGDEQQMVIVEATNTAIGKNTRRAVRRLVLAQRSCP